MKFEFKFMNFIKNIKYLYYFIFTDLSTTLFSFFLIWINKSFIDYAIDLNRDKALFYLFLIVVINLYIAIIKLPVNFIKNNFSQRIRLWSDDLLYKKVNGLDMEIVDTKEFNDSIALLNTFTEKSIEFITYVSSLLSEFVGLFLLIYILKFTNLYIVFIIFVFIFISLFINKKYSVLMKNYWFEYIATARLYNYFSKILTDREFALERKLFSYTDAVNQKFSNAFDEAQLKNKARGNKRFVLNLFIQLFQSVFYAIVMFVLFPYLKNGSITIGYYFVVTGTIISTVGSLSLKLGNLYIVFEFLGLCKKYDEFLSNYTDKFDNEVKFKNINDILKFKIEFKNVFFKYNNSNEYALKNFSYSFIQGRKYAIVGRNGSGKTTLINLLTGVYNCTSGEIFINGINIENISNEEKSKLMAVILQDFCKLPISLKDNIVFDKEFDLNKINKILKDLNLEKVIESMPYGIDTNLGKLEEVSSDISGGQWQKIMLARILYDNKKIMILDEPTASLDPLSEAKLYKYYRKYINDNTLSIVVTHRIKSIVDFDEILLIDDGNLKEYGNHNSLIEKNGIYNEMYESQRYLYE